ncbi:MAG TPA: hypothetical protein VGB49_02070, partial [Caulobacteraceae bacterium]
MTDLNGASTRATPWHLWVVGIVALLWNAYGCYDYLMTTTGGEAYLRAMGEKMKWAPADVDAFVAYYASMPAWMTAVWAVGVWGGLLGALLLLLRMKLAVWVFVVSLLAYVLSVIATFLLTAAPDVVQSMIWMQVVIFAGCVFFVWYAWTM